MSTYPLGSNAGYIFVRKIWLVLESFSILSISCQSWQRYPGSQDNNVRKRIMIERSELKLSGELTSAIALLSPDDRPPLID